MNYLKIKLRLFSLLAILVVSAFLTSCEQEAITPNFTNIDDNTLLKSVLELSEVIDFDEEAHGKLVVNEAFLTQTINDDSGNPAVSLISIPIDNDVKYQLKSLDIAYRHSTKEFEFDIMEITYSDEFIEQTKRHSDIAELTEQDIEDRNITYSATHKHFALDGFLHAEQVYTNNILTVDYEDTSRGWTSCMFSCVVGKMSWRDSLRCGWHTAACLITQSTYHCLMSLKSCLGAKYWSDCNQEC